MFNHFLTKRSTAALTNTVLEQRVSSPPHAFVIRLPWQLAWLQHPKIPLLMSLLLQVTGLLWFLGTEVGAFIEEDEVGPIARLYAYPAASHIAFLAVAALTLALLFVRTGPIWQRALAGAVLVLAALTGWGFSSLLIHPLLLVEPAADGGARPESGAAPWDGLAWGVLVGAFYLMTQQVPFPHDRFGNIAYVFSYSLAYLLLMALATVALFALLHGVAQRLPRQARFAALNAAVSVLVFLALYASIRGSYADIARQFDLPTLPFILTSLLATALLFFLGEVRPGTLAGELEFLHRPLTARGFWIKLILLLVALRYWIDWLVNSHQRDFLHEFVWDVTNLTFPALALLLALALSERLLRRVHGRAMARAGAAVVLFAGLAFLLWKVNDPATLVIEKSRSLATFVSGNVRSALGVMGLERTSGPIAEQRRQVEARLREYSALPLMATDVFPETRPAALAGMPGFPALGFRPHIFVFVSDATTASHLSAYGYRRDTTPNLVRFARQAAVFDRYYTSGTSTQMGMRAMFTGTYIGRHTAGDPVLSENLCRAFAQNGYRLYLDSVAKILSLLNPPSECRNYSILRSATVDPRDWDDIAAHVKAHPDQPVFYYLYVHGGHTPWVVDPRDQVFGPSRLDRYDAMLRIADGQFGDMVSRIEGMGILERSVIVYTSDHGIGLGQHYDLGSYSNLYSSNAELPLVVRVPHGTAKRVENQYAQTDFRPSLEALMGFPPGGAVHGISFAPELFVPVPPRVRCTYSIALHRPRYAVQCSNGLKLIYYARERSLEIFNSRADAGESSNLALTLTPAQAAPLAESLARFLAFGKDSYAILR